MKVLKTVVLSAAFAVISAVGVFANTQQSQATDCTPGTNFKQFVGSVSGRDTLTVSTKGGLKLCNDVKVNFASYTINNTYNGKGFSNNPTALPQTSFYNQTVTLKKGTDGKTTVKVKVPAACVDYQIDAYLGPVQSKITTNEGFIGTNAIAAALFQRTQKDCQPPVVKKIDVCDIKTKKIVSVTEDAAKDTTKYAPANSEKCKEMPVVKMVPVCNPATNTVIEVNEKDASKYLPADSEKCGDAEVCVIDTKETKTVKKSEVNNPAYTTDSSVCEDTPETPEETPVEETPAELPETGPAAALMQLFGAGSLVASTGYYLQSRRK